MLKRIIVICTIILIPAAFYIAWHYGEAASVDFATATQIASTADENDQAPKVVIVATIASIAGSKMECTDKAGVPFVIEYTGETPQYPFKVGAVMRFVGHVHGGASPYFHATQVYND
ncbi:MAG: hypothetical protein D8M52_02320 [Chlorobi bacterium]|nr:MAG: hypothetical protein F9K28_01930 [Bacteroidota bacterium]KXK35221.1 MAG: hypothetical protein UZ06_CHB003000550 [Chlorobi bacterium OLB6]MBE2265471.1 hypothetical protein [Flavobacteriales bacterium]MBL1160537.1 hypothetical protein [Chlorobiota bacterium]MBW7853216.1 hypothetical protein [Candidatus Kapabacteria bacterium]MCC6331295.1 hypothetical protein [Ignavibacteria bacterium]